MKKTTIYAFALTAIPLMLNSCGMGKMVSVKPLDPAAVKQQVQISKDAAQAQVNYAMSAFQSANSFSAAFSDYSMVGIKGNDIKPEVAKVAPQIAAKLAPVLNEIVSTITTGNKMLQVNAAGGLANYLNGSNSEMELEKAIRSALKGNSPRLAVDDNSDSEILKAIYYIMNKKK